MPSLRRPDHSQKLMTILDVWLYNRNNYYAIVRSATKNDRIRVPEDTLSLPISESLGNQD
jgi:hypothetical protein